MEEQYNHSIEKNGKQYRYDPDYDCFYRVYTHNEWADQPHWSKYNWIYVTAVLCAICYYLQFLR